MLALRVAKEMQATGTFFRLRPHEQHLPAMHSFGVASDTEMFDLGYDVEGIRRARDDQASMLYQTTQSAMAMREANLMARYDTGMMKAQHVQTPKPRTASSMQGSEVGDALRTLDQRQAALEEDAMRDLDLPPAVNEATLIAEESRREREWEEGYEARHEERAARDADILSKFNVHPDDLVDLMGRTHGEGGKKPTGTRKSQRKRAESQRARTHQQVG